MCDRRAYRAARTVDVVGFNHDHDGILRIFVRRVRRKPEIAADGFVAGVLHCAVPVLPQIFKPSTAAGRPEPSSLCTSASMASRKICKLRGCKPSSSRTTPDGKLVATSPDAGSCGSMRSMRRGHKTFPPLAIAETITAI